MLDIFSKVWFSCLTFTSDGTKFLLYFSNAGFLVLSSHLMHLISSSLVNVSLFKIGLSARNLLRRLSNSNWNDSVTVGSDDGKSMWYNQKFSASQEKGTGKYTKWKLTFRIEHEMCYRPIFTDCIDNFSSKWNIRNVITAEIEKFELLRLPQ